MMNIVENQTYTKPMLGVVLSLFDGMSCGRIALERAGIKVNNYYASEIDKHAIKVTQHKLESNASNNLSKQRR